jgi:minor capsid 2 protein
LLKGYNHAVEIGEIHVLTGFAVYKNIAQKVEDKVIGLKAFDSITIESYTTLLINRVIGQTSTRHERM